MGHWTWWGMVKKGGIRVRWFWGKGTHCSNGVLVGKDRTLDLADLFSLIPTATS